MPVRATSKQTYRQVIDEGLLSRRRRQVYEALYSAGPSTSNELFEHMKTHFVISTKNQQCNLTTRLGELRDMGCVEESQERICRVTGRVVIEWATNDSLPKRMDAVLGRASRKNLIAECRAWRTSYDFNVQPFDNSWERQNELDKLCEEARKKTGAL